MREEHAWQTSFSPHWAAGSRGTSRPLHAVGAEIPPAKGTLPLSLHIDKSGASSMQCSLVLPTCSGSKPRKVASVEQEQTQTNTAFLGGAKVSGSRIKAGEPSRMSCIGCDHPGRVRFLWVCLLVLQCRKGKQSACRNIGCCEKRERKVGWRVRVVTKRLKGNVGRRECRKVTVQGSTVCESDRLNTKVITNN